MSYIFKVRVWDTYVVGPSDDPMDAEFFGIHEGDVRECNEMTIRRIEGLSAEDAVREALALTGRSFGEVLSVKESPSR